MRQPTATNPFCSREERANFFKNYESRNIPFNLRNCFFINYQVTDGFQEFLKGKIEDYLNSFKYNEELDNQRWLVLLGQNGCGKTHFAITIINELAKKNYMCKYVDAYSLFNEIKLGYAENKNKTYNYCSENIEVLVIDEVGVTSMSESEYNSLFVIINERYKKELPTIIISNCANVEQFPPAVADRLIEVADIIEFENISYRGMLKKDNQIDLEALSKLHIVEE